MKATLKCEKPDEIEFTMTITASAKWWEEFRGTLKEQYPAWDLTSKINDLLAQARKIYWTEEE